MELTNMDNIVFRELQLGDENQVFSLGCLHLISDKNTKTGETAWRLRVKGAIYTGEIKFFRVNRSGSENETPDKKSSLDFIVMLWRRKTVKGAIWRLRLKKLRNFLHLGAVSDSR